jgi:geranylgeranyl diphosphate synthase, type II
MNSTDFFKNIIEAELSNSAYMAFSSKPAELYDPIRYMLSLGGKRMRPALLMMSTELFGGDYLKALSPALAIEVFHNFSLLHDDIMDKAPLRRSQPTVHRKWNPDIAILSGDAMLVKSYELMMNVDDSCLRKVLTLFNTTAIEVCEGQQLDMNFETSAIDISVDDYIHMISLKTSVLLAAALKIGAIIASASDEDAEHIYAFGKNIGIAFQLQDDILDVYADSGKFGKQTGGDILSNKKTFLLIRALELAKGETAKQLQGWLSKNPAGFKEQEEKVISVKKIYDDMGVKELAEKEMNRFYEIASGELSKIHVPEERKKFMRLFADQLMVREH